MVNVPMDFVKPNLNEITALFIICRLSNLIRLLLKIDFVHLVVLLLLHFKEGLVHYYLI